ncbi:hypothetical protein [Deinococcus metalli]
MATTITGMTTPVTSTKSPRPDYSVVPHRAGQTGRQFRPAAAGRVVVRLHRARLCHLGFVAATLLGVWPLARKAVASARLGDPFSINMLSLAAIGAVAIGEAPEGAVVVFFFAVGELLEGIAAGRARAGIQALAALAPKTALLVDGNSTREVPADTLQVGQSVQVNPGGASPPTAPSHAARPAWMTPLSPARAFPS